MNYLCVGGCGILCTINIIFFCWYIPAQFIYQKGFVFYIFSNVSKAKILLFGIFLSKEHLKQDHIYSDSLKILFPPPGYRKFWRKFKFVASKLRNLLNGLYSQC